MNDDWLFAIAPYAAVLLMPLICGWRVTRRDDHRARATARRFDVPDRRDPVFVCGCAALAMILAGHGVLLFSPTVVMRWNQSIPRLLALETAGICLAVVSLIGITPGVGRRVLASGRETAAADVILLTLVTTEIASGIALALFYRWGSSWAAVTVAPYVVSLVKLAPRVPLVATTPFLVRLHVFGAFAVVGVTPFSSLADRIIVPLRHALSAASVPLAAWRYDVAGRAAALTRRGAEALSLSVEEES